MCIQYHSAGCQLVWNHDRRQDQDLAGNIQHYPLNTDHSLMTNANSKKYSFQGGSGSVQSIRFSNIRVSEVQTPIVIDQFYCDRNSCKNQTTAVALSSIAYESIKGTYTVKPVHLACSDDTPCSDISLTEIELQPMQEHYHMYDPFCWQAFGELYMPTVPPILCMQNGKPTSNRILSDHDICWSAVETWCIWGVVVMLPTPFTPCPKKKTATWYYLEEDNYAFWHGCTHEIESFIYMVPVSLRWRTEGCLLVTGLLGVLMVKYCCVLSNCLLYKDISYVSLLPCTII